MHLPRLEDLRVDHDLTQQDVADILFCKREVYRRYEKGIRELPLSYAITLAEYYHVSVDYLLGITNNPTPLPRINKIGTDFHVITVCKETNQPLYTLVQHLQSDSSEVVNAILKYYQSLKKK